MAIDWSTLLRPCALRLVLKVGDDMRILNLAAAGLARQHQDRLLGLSSDDLVAEIKSWPDVGDNQAEAFAYVAGVDLDGDDVRQAVFEIALCRVWIAIEEAERQAETAHGKMAMWTEYRRLGLE